jgi:hypothetical protein
VLAYPPLLVAKVRHPNDDAASAWSRMLGSWSAAIQVSALSSIKHNCTEHSAPVGDEHCDFECPYMDPAQLPPLRVN